MAAPDHNAPQRPRRRSLLRSLLLGLAALVALLGGGYVAYLGWLSHLSAREQAAPSTGQVLVYPDGRRVPLLQPANVTPLPANVVQAAPAPPPPTTVPTSLPLPHIAATAAAAPPATAASLTTTPPSVAAAATITPPPARTAAALPYLPPERISIPSISTDWPVVLSTIDHLPEFRGVGWLLGSAFPGHAGNMVLYGHLGGEHGTFMRLHKLQPGAEFSVATAEHVYFYRVRESFETTPDDVGVMAPTSGATATLITCSGPWIPALQTNERRLIVVADLVRSTERH